MCSQGRRLARLSLKCFFPLNTPEETKEEIVQQLGINETSNLGKYLGFPILHKGRRQNDFQFVVERVQDWRDGKPNVSLLQVGLCLLRQL